MTVPVEISAWKPAPFALDGETVFAVGDVHGCAAELAALLDTVATLAREERGMRRLVYLGDVVDRGPDTTGALRLWANHGIPLIVEDSQQYWRSYCAATGAASR